jgi:hypothetical protein
MSAFVHRTFSIILDLSAPEDDAAGIVGRLQFKPNVKGVHSAA